jgi:hypothetical protein
MPPFDSLLVGFVVVVIAVVVLAGVGGCLVYAGDIVAGRFHCDARDVLRDLLLTLLATVVARRGDRG